MLCLHTISQTYTTNFCFKKKWCKIVNNRRKDGVKEDGKRSKGERIYGVKENV